MLSTQAKKSIMFGRRLTSKYAALDALFPNEPTGPKMKTAMPGPETLKLRAEMDKFQVISSIDSQALFSLTARIHAAIISLSITKRVWATTSWTWMAM
jgi:hypothetical protein